jgi:hypothetical protein
MAARCGRHIVIDCRYASSCNDEESPHRRRGLYVDAEAKSSDRAVRSNGAKIAV